jgi:single-strand DNA-binding protein
MAGSLNRMQVIGRLGADPEIKYTSNGTAVANLSVATDESYVNKQTGQKVEKTEWHSVTLWKGQAEFAAKYLNKGNLVFVEGSMGTQTWEGPDGKTNYKKIITARNIQSLEKLNADPNALRGQVQQQQTAPQAAPTAPAPEQSPYDGFPAYDNEPPIDDNAPF